MIPRVFIGTMYSGEGDFEECCKAINSQKDVVITHVVIKDFPEREAHNALWSAWRTHRASSDMFIKVDADTVLASTETASEFWKLMTSNPRITGIQAPLFDYFTDSAINGLNCFSPGVTFNDTTSGLFCDRGVDVDHDIVVSSENVPLTLKPAGFHCYRSTLKQAFHYGLHRMLKGHIGTINSVKTAYKRHCDDLRAMALMGAQCADTFKDGGFNYTDERFNQVFKAVSKNPTRVTIT